MGNFLRRSCAVHPDSNDERRRRRKHMEEPPQEERLRRSLRIKVRMRRDQLEEILYLARRDDDQLDGNKGKIGLLILKECMEGRLPATVLSSGDDVRSQRCGSYVVRSRRILDSIAEE